MSPPKRKGPRPGGGNHGTGQARRLDYQYTPNAAQIKGPMFGRWGDFYASSYPAARHLLSRPGSHGPCPLCGGTDRARFFPDVAETGGFHCNNCGTCADGLATVMLFEGCQFPEALRNLAAWLGLDGEPSRMPRKALNVIVRAQNTPVLDTKALELLEKVLGESIPLDHPDAEPGRRYLDRRGVLLDPLPAALRFHPGLRWKNEAGRWEEYPAIVALIQDPSGRAIGIQRFFLTTDGKRAIKEKPWRVSFKGASIGGAVRLFEPGPVMVVAEGVENALTGHLLVSRSRGVHTPAWSALCADGLANLEIPALVEEVWIAADNDPHSKGQDAAMKLERRLKERGVRTHVSIPPEPGQDWNAVLMKAKAASHEY